MKKLFFFDTETTGLDPEKNEIVQIAGEICGEKFNFKCRPTNENIDQAALDIQGVTKEEVMQRPHPQKVFDDLLALLLKYVGPYDPQDRLFAIGHNVSFDINFIYKFFEKYCEKNPPGSKFKTKYSPGNFFKGQLCTISMYQLCVMLGFFGHPKSYALESLCEVHKIELNPHDAMFDIDATIQLFDIMESEIRNNTPA